MAERILPYNPISNREFKIGFAESVKENILHLNVSRLPISSRFQVEHDGRGTLVLTGSSSFMLQTLLEAISVEYGGPSAWTIVVESLADDTNPRWDDHDGLTRITIKF